MFKDKPVEDILSSSKYPVMENIFIDEKESYSCTECSSNIEILSINYNESEITFKCHNHGIKKMLIHEYINSMKNNTYLFDKCSICYKEQSLIKKFFILKYCINCNIIICNDCKDKHINNDNNKHFLINNNERRIRCLLHPDNDNVNFCFNCKRHICNKCLESRKHIDHDTKSLLQFIPSNNEKKHFQIIIDKLNEKKQKLEDEKINITNNYNNELNETIKKIKDECESMLNSEEIEEKKELELNEIKRKGELEELKIKYEMFVEKINIKYKSNEDNIKNEHQKTKDNIKHNYNKRILESANKLSNHIESKEISKTINNLSDLILIHQIIKKTQEKYRNNYYNNINYVNTISFYSKNKYKSKSLDNKNLSKKEEIKINSNSISQSLIKNDVNTNNNDSLSKKLKNENKKLITKLEKIKDENKKLKKENCDLQKKNSLDTLNLNKYDSKKSKSNIIPYIKNENKNYIKNKSKEVSCDINKVNQKIFASYCPTDVDNSFIVFISYRDKNPYIVYSDMNKSIYCGNLLDNKIKEVKKNAHIEPISNFRYYFNKNIKSNNEYIMSISYRNSQIKIWNFKNWEKIINLKNIYQEGFIYSACFLYHKSNLYFLTSNWKESKSPDLIRIYNLKGDKINCINESNDNVFFMDIYYDKDKNANYIITSHKGYIKSYDYNKNKLYIQYKDKNNISTIFSFIIYKDDKILKLIESSDNGFIRLWCFHSGCLYSKFQIEDNIWIGGICLYNKDYLLVGCGDKTIKIIKLNEGIIIKSLYGHNSKVCTIKKINIPNYGEYIFSLGKDNKIIKWTNIIGNN